MLLEDKVKVMNMMQEGQSLAGVGHHFGMNKITATFFRKYYYITVI